MASRDPGSSPPSLPADHRPAVSSELLVPYDGVYVRADHVPVPINIPLFSPSGLLLSLRPPVRPTDGERRLACEQTPVSFDVLLRRAAPSGRVTLLT